MLIFIPFVIKMSYVKQKRDGCIVAWILCAKAFTRKRKARHSKFLALFPPFSPFYLSQAREAFFVRMLKKEVLNFFFSFFTHTPSFFCTWLPTKENLRNILLMHHRIQQSLKMIRNRSFFHLHILSEISLRLKNIPEKDSRRRRKKIPHLLTFFRCVYMIFICIKKVNKIKLSRKAERFCMLMGRLIPDKFFLEPRLKQNAL